MRLSEGSQEKAVQAAATLRATLSEAENPVPDHFPAVLNLLNNIKTDEVLPSLSKRLSTNRLNDYVATPTTNGF